MKLLLGRWILHLISCFSGVYEIGLRVQTTGQSYNYVLLAILIIRFFDLASRGICLLLNSAPDELCSIKTWAHFHFIHVGSLLLFFFFFLSLCVKKRWENGGGAMVQLGVFGRLSSHVHLFWLIKRLPSIKKTDFITVEDITSSRSILPVF